MPHIFSVHLPQSIISSPNKKNWYLLKFTSNSSRMWLYHCTPVSVTFVIAPNVATRCAISKCLVYQGKHTLINKTKRDIFLFSLNCKKFLTQTRAKNLIIKQTNFDLELIISKAHQKFNKKTNFDFKFINICGGGWINICNK